MREARNWRVQKSATRQMIETARLRSGKKRQRNNAHGFLRVIGSVPMGHPGRAKDLQLPENGMNELGVKRWSATSNKNINSAPKTKPASGDVIIGTTTFGQSPCAISRPTNRRSRQRGRRRKVRRSARDWNSTAGRPTRWQCSRRTQRSARRERSPS